MTQPIDCSQVRSVLLVDGWHRLKNQTFSLQQYEYANSEGIAHAAGENGMCSTGFQFTDEGGYVIRGPLTSILASQAV